MYELICRPLMHESCKTYTTKNKIKFYESSNYPSLWNSCWTSSSHVIQACLQSAWSNKCICLGNKLTDNVTWSLFANNTNVKCMDWCVRYNTKVFNIIARTELKNKENYCIKLGFSCWYKFVIDIAKSIAVLIKNPKPGALTAMSLHQLLSFNFPNWLVLFN